MTTSIRLRIKLLGCHWISSQPRYGLLRCPAPAALCLLSADRGHSFLLAYSATGSARKRPRFDMSPYPCNYSRKTPENQGAWSVPPLACRDSSIWASPSPSSSADRRACCSVLPLVPTSTSMEPGVAC